MLRDGKISSDKSNRERRRTRDTSEEHFKKARVMKFGVQALLMVNPKGRAVPFIIRGE